MHVRGWWAHLLAQKRSSRRVGRQGLLGSPLADLLELVLNKVLQGSELRLAAATSVHVILICNKPVVSGTWEGLQPQAKSTQGWHQNQRCLPWPSERLRTLSGAQGASSHPLEVCRSRAYPKESSIGQGWALTIHLGCRNPLRLWYPRVVRRQKDLSNPV